MEPRQGRECKIKSTEKWEENEESVVGRLKEIRV